MQQKDEKPRKGLAKKEGEKQKSKSETVLPRVYAAAEC